MTKLKPHFDEVWGTAHVLSLHCPLTNGARHPIGTDTLADPLIRNVESAL